MNHVYKLHTRLLKTGKHNDPLSLRRLLLSCTSIPEALSYTLSVFKWIPSPDTFAWNTVIRTSSHTSPTQSLSLFTKMHRDGISPDHFTFPFVLKSCSRLQTGQEVHSLILKLGLDSDIYIQNALIHFYGSRGLVDVAWKLFDEMLERDLFSYSSMVTCLVNNGFNVEALDLFREMQNSTSIRPDEVMMVSLISGISCLGALELGKWTHLFIKQNSLKLTISMGTALVNMYSRCGCIEEALKVFDEMPKRNVITWTAMIDGLAVHGKSREALTMFHEMKKSGLHPDHITFVGALVACSHGGLLEEGRQVFQSITREYGMEPRLEHYGCMVDLLGRAGLLKEAYEFIERMPIKPNAVIWRTLLGACVSYNNVELAKCVKEKLIVLEPSHDGDYVLLSNVYGGINHWVEKERVRSKMRERRIGKKPGCSLIEVDGIIHEFVVGDGSHSQSEVIGRLLPSIIDHLRLAGYTPDTSNVLFDVEEEEKEKNISYHSEKLAVAFALLTDKHRKTIRVMKNLRICSDCYQFMKFVSKVFEKEIIVRDRNRFHHFEGGACSCRDYW